MIKVLEKIPMPIVGTMLAVATLGNLVQSYGDHYRNILGILAGIIYIIVTIKFISGFEDLKGDLNTPLGASVFPTYSMSMILLATYIKPYFEVLAILFWVVGIVLHIILIIFFTNKYVRNFNMKHVFPSWFIVYVGIVIAAVTGRAFNPQIGHVAFYLGFVCYLFLLFMVGKRVFIVKEIPEPALPTFVIFSSPGSLCLVGYLNNFYEINMILFWILLILSQTIYLIAISKLPTLLKLKFYPSYSSFAYPLVISALALKLSNGFLQAKGYDTGALSVVVLIEEFIAIIMVFYVLIRYIHFIKNNESISNRKQRLDYDA